MERGYIKIKRPPPLPNLTHLLNELDDDFWKNWIFYHLLNFYLKHDKERLKKLILIEKGKPYPSIENVIAKFVRSSLNDDKTFNMQFYAFGENITDNDHEGYYDITIHSTNWKSKHFYFECKNLDNSQDLINKYVYYNTYRKDASQENIFDGGVYRYFNGKYAQKLDFGGMLGFVLEGDLEDIKTKIFKKLEEKFKGSPEGDLSNIIDNSIEGNSFTFNTIHNRSNLNFTLHHLLLNLS